MAQHGHEVVGFTVHVPHYLAQTDYPAAAEALLAQVAKTGVAADAAGRADRGGGRASATRSTSRSAPAPKSLKWWRRWSASTMRSLPLRRTDRCWHATRICPAARNWARSSSDSWPSRPGRSQKTTTPETGTTCHECHYRPDDEVGDMTDAKPRKPNLRPVRELTPTLQFRTIHGYRRAFRVAGSGSGDPADPRHRRQLHDVEHRADQARPAVHRHRARPARPRQVRQAARRLLGGRLRQRHARSAQRARHRHGSPSSGIRSAAVWRCSSPTSSRSWWTG